MILGITEQQDKHGMWNEHLGWDTHLVTENEFR